MRNRIKKMLVAIAALGALAFGGSAIAQAGSGSGQPTTTPSAQSAENASEKSEAAGSEVPGNDGPGGHADEPGNPNADHQFQGKE